MGKKPPPLDTKGLIDRAYARLENDTSGSSVKIDRRRVSDRVFQQLEAARILIDSLMQESRYTFLRDHSVSVPVHVDENEAPLNIAISSRAILALAAATSMAKNWGMLEDKDKALATTVKDLMERGYERYASSYEQATINDPRLGGAMYALSVETVDENDQLHQLTSGVDSCALNSPQDFTVDSVPGGTEAQKLAAISTGILQRLYELCGERRKATLGDMGKWREYTDRIELPSITHVNAMRRVYDSVCISPTTLSDLVSSLSEVRSQALLEVEGNGGFLHDADLDSLSRMIQFGKAAIYYQELGDKRIPIAYTGVLTDQAMALGSFSRMCGFDAGKKYEKKDDLPTKSNLGWDLTWINPELALMFFQNAHRVAESVEVAVQKTPGSGPGPEFRRHSGIATALKHHVYSQVQQPYILVRYFEIISVDGKPVPTATNKNSKNFIELLGGEHMGVAHEEFIVRRPNEQGVVKEVKLMVLWHMCLSERKKALAKIEQQKPRI